MIKQYQHSRSVVTVKYVTELDPSGIAFDLERNYSLSNAGYQPVEATVKTTTVTKFKLERPTIESYRNEIFGADAK